MTFAIWADDRLPSIQAMVVVDEVVEEYLRLGDLHGGFARLRRTNHKLRH